MTSSTLIENRIESYLSQLDAAMAGVAANQREDICREIRAHIVHSVANTSDHDGALDRVLRLLGTPSELAGRYITECPLRRAGNSFSPWLLLRTSWRWAKLGLTGITVFVVAVIGYSAAVGLSVAVLLKPLMPHRVGMWWDHGDFIVGVPSQPERMHELLGQTFIPVMAVLAFAFAVGTTFGLRLLMRQFAPRQFASVRHLA